MAHDKDFQSRAYPLAAYNFVVTVSGRGLAFAEVSGLALEYDSAVYRHGLGCFEGEAITTFYFDSFTTMTLSRGTLMGRSPLFLYQWLGSRESRPLRISLCDAKGEPVLSWKVDRAVPIRLEAPKFDAGSTEASIDRLELKVRGISLIDHTSPAQ